MKYQNFAVELSALPDGRFRIEVASPVGEATADVSSPFTTAEITDALQILGRERASVTKPQMIETARAFGDKLFAFLLQSNSDISNAYFASLARVGNDGLRIRLSVERAGVLSHLPWELLRDPAREHVGLSRATPIVRYTQQLSIRPPVPITLPLRVLVMISSPTDFPKLDVEGEWTRLQEATQDLQARGMILLERLDNATLLDLQRTLRGGEYHAFHFIGHSDFDAAANQGVLVFEDPANLSKGQLIGGGALARELGEETTLRLVILNSCRSARRVEADPFAGVASSLVARGIPAVVAMQFEITDRAAKVFAEEFYRALAELLPIDTSVSEARRAIANVVQNTEWATPVLYMRSESGLLFQTSETSAVTLDSTTTIVPPAASTPQRLNRAWLAILGGIGAGFIVLLLILNSISPIFSPPTPTATPTLTPTITPTATVSPTVTPRNPASLPDLQITRFRISPESIAPGQFFRVNITITNAGSSSSGRFNWSWDSNLTGTSVDLDTIVQEVDNILPGSSRSVSFSWLYGWWGRYTTQVQVDVDDDVEESNNRNNEFIFNVNIQELPFNIDFTLLPDTTIVEPPLALGGDQYVAWNLLFNTAAPQTDPCFATPLQLIDVDGDTLMTTADDAEPTCAELPLSIIVTRRFVSDAQVFLLPEEAGSATLTYYSDAAGTQPILTTPSVTMTPGEIIALGGIGNATSQIRRIDIDTTTSSVRVTRLVLSPPPTLGE